MAETPKKDFTEAERKHIMAGLQMLLMSTKRAENQMRTSNREAVADALKTELNSIADTAKKADRLI